jgi:hypothetical protein
LFVGRIDSDHHAAPFDLERIDHPADQHTAPRRPNAPAQQRRECKSEEPWKAIMPRRLRQRLVRPALCSFHRDLISHGLKLVSG